MASTDAGYVGPERRGVIRDSEGYTVSERLMRLEVTVGNLREDLQSAARAAARPSWAVTTIIAMSTAANGALLAALVVVAGQHGKL